MLVDDGRKSPPRFLSFVFLLYVAGHVTTRRGPDAARGPDFV